MKTSDVYHCRKQENYRRDLKKMSKKRRDDSENLPAWQRHISGPSLEGRPKHLIGAEPERLENQQERKQRVRRSTVDEGILL